MRFSLSRKETVDELREKIDQVDEKIIEFLSQRACLAQKIGQTKNLGNEEIYVPSREKEILQRVSRLNRGPLPEQAIRSVYREVLSASRSLEGPLRVAYLGPDATFTQMAARERFGLSTVYVSVASIQGVFQEVERGRANFGVVPVENSTEGVVTHTLDMLVEADVKICAEIYLEIHQCLLSRPGRSGQFQRIVSHPQAVAQCRDWLANHFPQVPVDEVASTAQAAQMAAQDATLAAIAGRLASEFYGLEIVEENIEDLGILNVPGTNSCKYLRKAPKSNFFYYCGALAKELVENEMTRLEFTKEYDPNRSVEAHAHQTVKELTITCTEPLRRDWCRTYREKSKDLK